MSSKKHDAVFQRLRELMGSRVRNDEAALNSYSSDQSIYRIRPLAVTFPRDIDDIASIVRLAAEEQVPVHPRSGGSGTAGGALGPGIVVVFSKSGPLNRIVKIDDENCFIDAGAAVLHDTLQQALRERGLFLPADPSSGGLCLFGGNIATKASGPHALKHGSIDRYLLSVRFVTGDGTEVDTADSRSIPAKLAADIEGLGKKLPDDPKAVNVLRKRIGFKTASGYNLFTFLREDSAEKTVAGHVAQLFAGSVGTLGVITGAVVRAERRVEGQGLTLLYFRFLREAGDAVLGIREMGVDAIEIVNHRTLELVRNARREIPVPGGRCHLLMVEYSGPDPDEWGERIRGYVRKKGYELAAEPVSVTEETERENLWKVRKALLPLLRNAGQSKQALSIVNDVGVPVEFLAPFIENIEAVFDKHGLQAAIYGHAGNGNLHLRPFFDTKAANLTQLLKKVADEVYGTVFSYGGTVTGEHGMGLLRAPYLREEWGEKIYAYMKRVKQIFDPENVLNPDAMFTKRSVTDQLRQF